jgi:cold-inducible RNA-binding protein
LDHPAFPASFRSSFQILEVKMIRKLYVGNLSGETTEGDLEQLLGSAGSIHTVRIVRNQATGRSKGFAFVKMNDGGDKAILNFHGKNINGRVLTVIDAQRCLYAVTPIRVQADNLLR